MKVATHFIYGTRINNIHNICEIADSHNIKTKVDKNGNRVESQRRVLESLIRLNKGLHIYKVQNRGSIRDGVTVTDSNWRQFREFKAVLNITQVVATMAQYKERYVSLYGHIVKFITYKNITDGDLSIIYQDEVMKDPNMPQKISDVYFITATG